MVVMACWVLAMAAGLLWGRWWTGLCTAATLLSILITSPASFARWSGWLQAAVVGLTPWLLAAQREREAARLAALRTQEAACMADVAETTRSVLALQQATQQMERQIVEIAEVYHVTKETARTLHLGELFAAVARVAPRLLDAPGLRLIDCSDAAPQVLRAARTPDGEFTIGEGTEPQAAEQALIAEIAKTGTLEASAGLAWAPLWREQKPIGLLVADGLPPEQLKTLSMVGDQLSLQLARIHLYRQVESLAVTDALTGVAVRRHFLQRAEEELVRAKRHGFACALLMVDLDSFKQKNDTYGHLVGDVVLREVAGLLSRNLRTIDLIGRFGGEEFVLLLVETNGEHAVPAAERLRQLVEVHPIHAYDELLNQTISIGVAGYPEDAKALEALIQRADEALYAAKRAGRNRVMRAAPLKGAEGVVMGDEGR